MCPRGQIGWPGPPTRQQPGIRHAAAILAPVGAAPTRALPHPPSRFACGTAYAGDAVLRAHVISAADGPQAATIEPSARANTRPLTDLSPQKAPLSQLI